MKEWSRTMKNDSTRTLTAIVLSAALFGCPTFEGTGETSGATGTTSPASSSPSADPEVLAVDWLGRGVLYAGKVVERRYDLTSVVYADGDREWVETSRIHPWPDLTDKPVTVYTVGAARPAQVIEIRGFLLHVRFEDGTHTWYGRDQLYTLQGGPPEVGGAGQVSSSYPLRQPVPASDLRVGAKILCYWFNAGQIEPSHQWLAEILSIDGAAIQVKYLYDDTEGTIRPQDVLRVFAPVEAAPEGARVWLAGDSPVGTIVQAGSETVGVNVGGEVRTVPAAAVVGLAPEVTAEALLPGHHVTALWSGTSPYTGKIVGVAGDQVTIAWHDGSAPSPVPIADVLDVWTEAAR